MALQYDRKCTLKVAGMTFNQEFRIRFTIESASTETPNKAEFILTNLNAKSKDAILHAGEGAKVEFSAAYKENEGFIYKGSIIQVRCGRENPTDTYVTINCATGDIPYNHAHMNTTVEKGKTAKDHFDKMAEPMAKYGISVGFTPDIMKKFIYPRGVGYFGLSRNHLRDLANTFTALWSIQNDELQFVPLKDAIPGGVPDINAQSGMVGMPVQTMEAIIVRALINPEIKVNGLLHLNNQSIQRAAIPTSITDPYGASIRPDMPLIAPDGIYKIYRAQWDGDTRGQAWYVTCTCLAHGHGYPGGAYVDLQESASNASGAIQFPGPPGSGGGSGGEIKPHLGH